MVYTKELEVLRGDGDDGIQNPIIESTPKRKYYQDFPAKYGAELVIFQLEFRRQEHENAPVGFPKACSQQK